MGTFSTQREFPIGYLVKAEQAVAEQEPEVASDVRDEGVDVVDEVLSLLLVGSSLHDELGPELVGVVLLGLHHSGERVQGELIWIK